jgi:hypothetical protein
MDELDFTAEEILSAAVAQFEQQWKNRVHLEDFPTAPIERYGGVFGYVGAYTGLYGVRVVLANLISGNLFECVLDEARTVLGVPKPQPKKGWRRENFEHMPIDALLGLAEKWLAKGSMKSVTMAMRLTAARTGEMTPDQRERRILLAEKLDKLKQSRKT